MKKIIKSFLLSLSFIFISNQSFAINNKTYLICKKVDENNVNWLLGLLIKKIPEAKQIIPNAKTFCGPNLSINMPRPNVTTPQIIA